MFHDTTPGSRRLMERQVDMKAQKWNKAFLTEKRQGFRKKSLDIIEVLRYFELFVYGRLVTVELPLEPGLEGEYVV